ncbi:unnamed protein product [Symbiodinium sp. CCMP2592]|nr:unnamed protein product [Symbiodinium sp. CCMP2592]
MVVACRFKASLSFQLRRFACERGASFPLCKCQASSAEKHHAMETWLKSKADQLAQAAQDHVSAVQQSASKLAVAFDPVGAPPDDLKDVEFRDGPLGFTLEGNLVVAVQPSSQAERLGVEIGDRLVKIDGYEVPRYETEFEEQRARKVIAKWLKEMPRPAILTFELQQDLGEEVAKETPQPRSEEAMAVCSGFGRTSSERGAQSRRRAGSSDAELQRTQEERKKLAAELKENDSSDSQEACGQLSAQVESLKKESGPNLRRLSEMEEQLQTLRTQNKELVSAVNASSASRADEELLKLRQALAATQEASQAAVQAAQAKTAAAEDKYSEQQQEVKALMLQVADLTEQAESRRLQIEPMEKDYAVLRCGVEGFQAAHEAELDLFREEQAMRKEQHQQEIQELQLRLGEQQIKAERELQDAQLQLQKSKEALQEAQVNAEAAAVEATAARREVEALRSNQCLEPEALHAEPNGEEDRADPSPMLGDSLQVLELRKRINLLETRLLGVGTEWSDGSF